MIDADYDPAMVSTTKLGVRLGLSVTSALIKRLGITPAVEMPVGTYWRVSDYQRICYALAAHLAAKATEPAPLKSVPHSSYPRAGMPG